MPAPLAPRYVVPTSAMCVNTTSANAFPAAARPSAAIIAAPASKPTAPVSTVAPPSAKTDSAHFILRHFGVGLCPAVAPLRRPAVLPNPGSEPSIDGGSAGSSFDPSARARTLTGGRSVHVNDEDRSNLPEISASKTASTGHAPLGSL